FEDNPRTISDSAMERLKDSVRSLGLFKPLLVWTDRENNPVVIGGNQRLRALRSLRDAGEYKSTVPVIMYHGDEATARTIALRDNSQDGDWDWHALSDYVTDLETMAEEMGTDMDLLGLTGLDASVLDDLRALADTRNDALDALGIEPSFEPQPTGDTADGDSPDDSEDSDPAEATTSSLADDFIVPPFTILNQRSGPWKQRREKWLSIGIRSDLGRDGALISGGSMAYENPGIYDGKEAIEQKLGRTLTMAEFLRDHYQAPPQSGAGITIPSASGRDPQFYKQKQQVEAKLGREISTEEFERDYYVRQGPATGLSGAGTSVFDPVLAELLLRWFAPPGAEVIDPFAGGSVRGMVSALCGYRYTGIDLRDEQVKANRDQWRSIQRRVDRPDPEWITGDSSEIDDLLDADRQFDFLLTCPPY
ncbi:MAG: ParB N-terminal domain-containing protein, partial [Actinomycetota bacterium]|nr:ParB N-terminal domain-containing protein [Actinomycetota bacterium]